MEALKTQPFADFMDEVARGRQKLFFRAVRGFMDARQNGQPIDEYIDEFQAIADHCDQPALARHAKAMLTAAYTYRAGL